MRPLGEALKTSIASSLIELVSGRRPILFFIISERLLAFFRNGYYLLTRYLYCPFGFLCPNATTMMKFNKYYQTASILQCLLRINAEGEL
jgi:hypothetical protein